MLELNDLKTWLHKKEISLPDKLLMVLSTFDKPAQVKDITAQAASAGLKIPKRTNTSSILTRTNGLAIRIPEGWELAPSGETHLKNIGINKLGPAAVNVAIELRSELQNISNTTTRSFAEEAIKCYEYELYRSSIVMSWLVAIDILHKYVHKNHLSDFNKEAKRVNNQWKPARTTDDLGKMKESDFLERICALSIIGKNVKKELKDCLDRRNACGHQNSLKIGPKTVAHHLEILLLNVFKVF